MAALMRVGSVKQQGFTFIGLLIFITISGMAMAAVSITWQYRVQIQREKELLFIGRQYQKAIERYYLASPNGINSYPKNLQELLLDKRFSTPKRHLRRLYTDPFAHGLPMEEIKENGLIVGVHSHSTLSPRKKVNFAASEEAFAKAKSYADWKFTYLPNMSTMTNAALQTHGTLK
jgi:type II secretory pathway pseudopilin PulG